MVTIPFGNLNPVEGIVGMLPSDYRLYLESMMPSMNEKPIGDEYFTNEMRDQIKDQVLSKTSRGDNKGLITEIDYQTERNPMGTNDPSSLTGFNQLFNTLGSYQYDFVPNDEGGGTINITDRYDWNPDYADEGYVGEGGTDVTTPMLLNQLYRQLILGTKARGGFDAANTLEMLGNYFGQRESEGEGRDVEFSFPVTKEDILEYVKPEPEEEIDRRRQEGQKEQIITGTGDSTGPAGKVVMGNQVVQSPQQETQRIRNVLDARRRGANIGFSAGGLASINDVIGVL
tara:strand:- start:99 stop:956 length:858 start_codon:yes stop_codon:yes gene_type:complete